MSFCKINTFHISFTTIVENSMNFHEYFTMKFDILPSKIVNIVQHIACRR